MSDNVTTEVEHFMHGLVKRNPGEPEFHQAVQEVVETLMPVVRDNPQYEAAYRPYGQVLLQLGREKESRRAVEAHARLLAAED